MNLDMTTANPRNICLWAKQKLRSAGFYRKKYWEMLEYWMQVELWAAFKREKQEPFYIMMDMEPPAIKSATTKTTDSTKWPDLLICSPQKDEFFWWELKHIKDGRGVDSFRNDLENLLHLQLQKTQQYYKDKLQTTAKKINRLNDLFEGNLLKSMESGHHSAVVLALVTGKAVTPQNIAEKIADLIANGRDETANTNIFSRSHEFIYTVLKRIILNRVQA